MLKILNILFGLISLTSISFGQSTSSVRPFDHNSQEVFPKQLNYMNHIDNLSHLLPKPGEIYKKNFELLNNSQLNIKEYKKLRRKLFLQSTKSELLNLYITLKSSIN